MLRLLLCLCSVPLSAAASAAQSQQQAGQFNPRALELFHKDWVLMKWAVEQFDSDGDRSLSLDEAQPALAAFQSIADGDGNGRVTTYEYDRARDFIIARY